MRIIAKCIICGKDFYRISEAGKRTREKGARSSKTKTCSRVCSILYTDMKKSMRHRIMKDNPHYIKYQKEYREKNKERINIKQQKYYNENRDKINQQKREYRKKNREMINKRAMENYYKRKKEMLKNK